MQLEVVLVLASPDVIDPSKSSCLLVDRGDGSFQLPVRTVKENESSVQTAAILLKECTGLVAKIAGAGWVNLEPMPLADAPDRTTFEGRIVGVPYAAIFPAETVKPRHGYVWVPITEALKSRLFLDHDQILQRGLANVRVF